MDRRWAGVAIVLLVILAAVAIPQFDGVKVWGVAVAAPPPRPPTPGECLIAPIDSQGADIADPARASAPYPSLPLQPCTASRYGEVTAVIQASTESVPSQLTPLEQGEPPARQGAPTDADRCAALDGSYLGLPAGSGSGSSAGSSSASPATAAGDVWDPTTNYTPVIAGPTELQRGFGQRWLACVVIVGDLAGGATELIGTLRNAAITGSNRDQLGDCVLGIDLTVGGIPLACLIPHQGELFGGGPVLRPLSWNLTDLTQTCAEFIKRATDLADPTVGGELRIEVQGTYAGNPLCGLESVTGRRLRGSLLGIGDRPIPWV